VVKHNSEKGAIIIFAIFFIRNINFNLYDDVFEDNIEYKSQMGIINILKNKYEKLDFSCFLVLQMDYFPISPWTNFLFRKLSLGFNYLP
jgi:hypothetical protein